MGVPVSFLSISPEKVGVPVSSPFPPFPRFPSTYPEPHGCSFWRVWLVNVATVPSILILKFGEQNEQNRSKGGNISLKGIRGPERNFGAGSAYGSTAHSPGRGFPGPNLYCGVCYPDLHTAHHAWRHIDEQ